jgi:ribosomal protein S27E
MHLFCQQCAGTLAKPVQGYARVQVGVRLTA